MSWRAESAGRVVSSQTMSGYVVCLKRTGKQLVMLSGKMTGSVLRFITITWASAQRIWKEMECIQGSCVEGMAAIQETWTWTRVVVIEIGEEMDSTDPKQEIQ